MNFALRRLVALLLAVGLLPAASGGSVCLAHWGLDASAAKHEHGGSVPEVQHVGHDAESQAHAHHGVTPPSSGTPDGGSAPTNDQPAPCTALSACGVLVTVDATRPAATPAATPRAVAQRAHTIPPGPASAPEVPPPRA